MASIAELIENLKSNRAKIDKQWGGTSTLPSPGASSGEIAALEDELGFSLPDDYREFLGLVNGWESVGGYLQFMTIAQVADEGFQIEFSTEEIEEKQARFICMSLMDDRGIVLLPPTDGGGDGAIAHIEQDLIEDPMSFSELFEGFVEELIGFD